LKGAPLVKFDPDQIEILLRVSRVWILVAVEDICEFILFLILKKTDQVFDCFSGANNAWTNKERTSK
jgi:hypothetical protein